jgi:hypothetical protein
MGHEDKNYAGVAGRNAQVKLQFLGTVQRLFRGGIKPTPFWRVRSTIAEKHHP